MRILNTRLDLQIERHCVLLGALAPALHEALGPDAYPLRFHLAGLNAGRAQVEVTIVEFAADEPHADTLRDVEILAPRCKTHQAEPFTVVQVVPTGVRCEFGGYAGDATPATNLLAAAADFVVTHPNAVNASEINELAPNVLYVEGKSLDDFLLGHVGLLPVAANRIGTVIDQAESESIDQVVSAIDAARASAGIDSAVYTLLGRRLGARVEWSEQGCAVGTIDDPNALIEAVDRLLGQGLEAVSVVSVIEGSTEERFRAYLEGEGPNPSGGVEAIISHLISKLYRIPTAHSPLPYYASLRANTTANPRAAAEFISTPHHFSVLKGLHRAPRLVRLPGSTDPRRHANGLLDVDHVGAVVAPATALGGIPALAAESSGIPLVAVRDNTTILAMSNAELEMPNVIEVGSYLEAAGIVLALRKGICLESLRRPLSGALKV